MNKELPKFKYNPDPIKSKTIEIVSPQTCDCCGQKTYYRYTGPIYAVADIRILCPFCIADGRAQKKYACQFTGEIFGEVAPAIETEILARTPGYLGLQEEIWLTHCQDGGAFLGTYAWKELQQSGLAEKISQDYDCYPHPNDLAAELVTGDSVDNYTEIYLFISMPTLWPLFNPH